MAYFSKMDVINVNALPVVPLDEHLAVSPVTRNVMKNAMRKTLEDHPPSCFVGSMHQVNQTIGEMDLSPNPLVNSLTRVREKHSILAEAQHPGMSSLSLVKGKQQIKICWQSCTSIYNLTTLGQMSFQMGWTSVTW